MGFTGSASRRGFPRRFFPKTLVTGLVLIVGGGAILAVYDLVGVMLHALLIGGLCAIPVGVLVALSSWGRACDRCRGETKQARVALPGGKKGDAKNVLASGSGARVVELIRARGSVGVLSVLEMKLFYCPACRRLVEIKVAGWEPRAFRDEDAVAILEAAGVGDPILKTASGS